MSISETEFRNLRQAIEQALGHFGSRPPEPGFDQEVYDELRRIRETLMRGRRDLRDPNLQHDSRSPSGSP